MKRLLAVPFVAFGLFVWSGAASADHGDVAGKACADMVNVDFGYDAAKVATARITTVEPSCKGITYTLHVVVDPGDSNTAIVTTSTRGNGTTAVPVLTTTITDDDSIVCAYVTSSRGGPEGAFQAFDRVPNALGCTELVAGGGGGSGGHA